jgi:hypothetical protein
VSCLITGKLVVVPVWSIRTRVEERIGARHLDSRVEMPALSTASWARPGYRGAVTLAL